MYLPIKTTIKAKFLAVILFVTFVSFGIFFYFSINTFSEDKKLFVMDLNMNLLRASINEIKLELKGRLEEMQVLVPRIYQPATETSDPYQGLPDRLRDEMIRVQFYRKKEDGSFEVTKKYINQALIDKGKIPATIGQDIDDKHKITPEMLALKETRFYNHSIRAVAQSGKSDFNIITLAVPGSFLDNENKELMIVINLSSEFLRRTLMKSELAEIFLIFNNGFIFVHPNSAETIDFSTVKFKHPIASRLKASRQFQRESLEIEYAGEMYLCNVSETGFPEIFAVSQIPKTEAFAALNTLVRKYALFGVLLICFSILVSVIFTSSLTANISKLREGAEQIASGNFQVSLDIRSNDEIQVVGERFEWMSKRLKELVTESAEKARLADELETARLVQSTIIAPTRFQHPSVQVESYYSPATECGGDFWDASLQGNMLTLYIGDATGHGAPAAIVTAVAKSYFTTINTLYPNPLPPEQILTFLNRIVYEACKGQLLMTMSLVQINLETGQLKLVNAGHESPYVVSSAGGKPEPLFAKGERLGFAPNNTYEVAIHQLNDGDNLLMYTDGISEAPNRLGKPWGERALKKAFGGKAPRPLATVKQDIVEGFQRHTNMLPQPDDITFVVLNWKLTTISKKVA